MREARSSSFSKTSQAATSGGFVSRRRLSGFSCATMPSSRGSPSQPFRRLRARSLFRRSALSMDRRQCASAQLKPSLVSRRFFSMSSARACSTGRPKHSPRLRWLLNLKHSRPLFGFSRRASAMCLMPSESRLLLSMLRTCKVLFFFSDSASSWACGFMRLEFESCRDSMFVLCSRAFISLGAMRGSWWGRGMRLPVKLKSFSVGSSSQARCTIQTIQSPRVLVFLGSSTMSAMSVISSTSWAKVWLTPVMESTPSTHEKLRLKLVEPVRFVAVIL
mmetsp:Transcript_14255/g.44833  ORF Transcript_14255/g.44833 Transcript_14255/m.44833 type:complete len:276 (-) Transcript_14255:1541-2368(-)